MKLAIISAGDSSRMISEGISIPKPLIRINGKPILQRIIEIGIKNGASSINCIINSKFPELNKFFEDNNFGVPVNLIIKSTPSSMHSLFELSKLLADDSFCLTTADTVFLEHEFNNFIEYAKSKNNASGILGITNFIDDEKPLCVKLVGERIISFLDKKDGLEYATGGIYYFSSDIFRMIESALDKRIERLRNFLRLLIENGFVLNAFKFSKIVDVDHVKDIKVAEELLRSENIL